MAIREESLNSTQLKELLDGHEELLNQLKLPNPTKRVKAIVEIKKLVQQKLTKLTPASSRTMLETLTQLSSLLLKDDDPDVYMESLLLLKFVVGGLAPHLSTLDLHLMIGSYLTTIVLNNSSEHVRT
jgi:hypothetical protein